MKRKDFFPKVGEVYLDGDGNRREVIYVAKSHIGTDNNYVAAINLSNQTVDSYTINGTYFNSGEDSRDLMPPEPKYRKYTIDEANELMGTTVKYKDGSGPRSIIGARGDVLVGIAWKTRTQLLDEFIHTDGTPCGVEIK